MQTPSSQNSLGSNHELTGEPHSQVANPLLRTITALSTPGVPTPNDASTAAAGEAITPPGQGGVSAGIEGGAAPSPAVKDGFTILNVAGPTPDELTPLGAVIGETAKVGEGKGHPLSHPKPKNKGGRPRSTRVDMLPVKVTHHCNALLRRLPGGVRGETVERAIVLLLEGQGIGALERALPELSNASARLQQVLEWLAKGDYLSPTQRATVEAAGGALVLHLKRILLP